MQVPSQRRHALAGRHVPHLEHSWRIIRPITRNDAPPVRKHGNAQDLQRSQIITKVQWTPQNGRSPSALSASVRRIRIYGIQNNALTCSSSTCRASLWRRLPARRVHRLCHCCRLWIDYSSCPLSLSIRYRHVTRHGSCSFGQPSGQSYLGSRWAQERAVSGQNPPRLVVRGPAPRSAPAVML